MFLLLSSTDKRISKKICEEQSGSVSGGQQEKRKNVKGQNIFGLLNQLNEETKKDKE